MTTILDLIGNTPLVEIRHLNPNPAVTLLAKLEYFNPGGSIKDRAALAMIAAGERSGELTADKIVIEATSGNTGIGLALVCSVKGYRLLLAMSEAVSVERQKILKARGADILLTPGHLGTDGAIEEVYRLAREAPDTYFMTDQFNNPANWQAHYDGTAVEIWQQTGGRVTTLVATLGTSGTLMGVARRLKEFDSRIGIIGVEPYLGHKLQGLKNMKEAYCPGIFEKSRLDQKINIDDEEAFDMTRRLAREEGLLVGMSSGAAMAIAVQQARAMASGTLVVILPDSGERYLSTPLFVVKEKVNLKLFNTMSRAKEPFAPLVPGKVSIYTCGPTAHAPIHLGEMRRFIVADLLCRYLVYRGYLVKHVMNITDLDDKTIAGSEKAGEALTDFTGRHIAQFERDLAWLGIKPADDYPRASDHLEDMVQVAEQLARKGFAYEKLRSLYFDISRFGDYGRLSGIDIDKIRLGATVDLDDYEKDNPRDFTLFKRARLSDLKRGIYTKTVWGSVRPSWHLQAAAISMKYLGQRFDIHASSRELMFPHHENLNAIAAALSGRPPVRCWVDCEPVMADGHKVDRPRAGMTPEDLRGRGYSGQALRYWLLTSPYRKPVTFSPDRIEDAARSLSRLNNCIRGLKTLRDGTPYGDLDQLLYDIKQGFASGLDDDLNISTAMASIFRVVKKVNRLMRDRKIDAAGARKVLDAFRQLDSVLNLLDFEEAADSPAVQKLIEERRQARAERNWPLADRLREQLRQMGVVVQDAVAGEKPKG
ncbi:MAG: cysteine synthase [Desulfobacterales bacterium]